MTHTYGHIARRLIGASFMLAALAGPAAAQGPDAADTLARPVAGPLVEAPPFPSDPQDQNAALYCQNIAQAAADARFARQANALTALQAEIDKRVKALEEKKAELEKWLGLREDFLRKADESIVAIITQMRPDAAALQLALMNEHAAAAILVKLTPRAASAILNEMQPASAARLTTTMAGMSEEKPKEGA